MTNPEENVVSEVISKTDILAATTEMCTAYMSNNALNRDDALTFIRQVHELMSEIAAGKEAASAASSEPLVPAVPIKKSVTPDYLVCLEDGKQLKMLKRHLSTSFGMTPDEYRAKWGLPHDYPMVAPNYANQRSELAKKIGLGTGPSRKRAAATAD